VAQRQEAANATVNSFSINSDSFAYPLTQHQYDDGFRDNDS
jgi:hypothetical protein